jgi:phage terminase large subunit
MDVSKQPIPILLFADSILGIRPYDWQSQILLNYEAGHQTAAACANFTGKTSTVFPITALWTLYNFPRARLMYLSATSAQVKNQFFASLERFRSRPAFASWTWLETAVRNPHGGFLFGRATDTGGNIEGLHDQPDSPAALLVDEAKSIRPEVLDALSRCHTTFRLFMSSTGPAFGGFYQICTAKAHLWRTFRVPSSMCPHVDPATIEADRENLKDSVFRIKHGAEFLYDAGDSMISLEHVRALIDNPPAFVPGKVAGFCDFAGAGDESVFALCEGNRITIEPEWCWRSRDTMHSVGKFLTLFRKLNLQGWQIGGDAGFGHQLMDRMAEEGFHLQRFNNGSPAKQPEIFFNLSAEQWSEVGQAIERRQIIIPNCEKLVSQLTSRRKLYDSKGRERLESKADLKGRGVESPDRADSLIGAIAMKLAQDQFALDPIGKQQMSAMMDQSLRLMERSRPVGYEPYVDFGQWW